MDDYNKEAIKARNILAKGGRWDEEKEEYICPHCNGVISSNVMQYGYDCEICGL